MTKKTKATGATSTKNGKIEAETETFEVLCFDVDADGEVTKTLKRLADDPFKHHKAAQALMRTLCEIRQTDVASSILSAMEAARNAIGFLRLEIPNGPLTHFLADQIMHQSMMMAEEGDDASYTDIHGSLTSDERVRLAACDAAKEAAAEASRMN
jgi:hypothetical protein